MSEEDKYVCSECFTDKGLKEFIENNAVSNTCSFCGAIIEELISVAIEDINEYISSCIYKEYDNAGNWLPFESAEGGYQGETWDTYDLLLEEIQLELPKDINDELFHAILGGQDDNVWCERDPFGLNDFQVARYSWESFCDTVKHKRRFFFLGKSVKVDREILSPGEILKRIFDYAEKIGLFIDLDPNTFFFRARYQRPNENLITAQQLGPPPLNLSTKPNRMSPAGIVMFYASDDAETSVKEIAKGQGTYVVGRFRTKRKAIVLDLAKLPEIPSIFIEYSDALEYDPRSLLIFLHHISREISKKINRDNLLDINYIPTQVVTEYVRSRLLYNKKRVDGIRYASAVHPGNASFVFFATQENLLPVPKNINYRKYRGLEEERWIELFDRSIHTL